jgi:hypothetical protein
MKRTPPKKATPQPPRALDDASDIEDAFWRGLKSDPPPTEADDARPAQS